MSDGLKLDRSAVVEGNTVLFAEDLLVPGLYAWSRPQDPGPVAGLAINLHRAESDLTPVPAEDLEPLLQTGNLQVATGMEDLLRRIEEHRVGRTYGEHLLWLVLLLLAVEFFYANRLLRAAPRLSQRLEVDAAGHVRGHIHHAAEGAAS